MSISSRNRRELNKLRELLWHFLENENCFFCKESFLPDDMAVCFGNATASPLDLLDITIHHKDGDHSNNAKPNRKLAHQSCHKSYHAKLVFAKFRKEAGDRAVGSCGRKNRRAA